MDAATETGAQHQGRTFRTLEGTTMADRTTATPAKQGTGTGTETSTSTSTSTSVPTMTMAAPQPTVDAVPNSDVDEVMMAPRVHFEIPSSSPSPFVMDAKGDGRGDGIKESTDASTDPEARLCEILSSLASHSDLVTDSHVRQTEVPPFLWKNLSSEHAADDDEDDGGGGGGIMAMNSPDVAGWKNGVSLMRQILPKLSPFELHSAASQCVVFTAGSVTHVTLCILLCCHALRRGPQPKIESRVKRWQSLLFETVRMFQHYRAEDDNAELLSDVLWCDFVVPACLQVVTALPAESYHIPTFAGLVGSTMQLMGKNFVSLSDYEASCMHGPFSERPSRISRHHNVVHQICQDGTVRESAETILMQPWRAHIESFTDHEVDEDVMFLRREMDLAWWTQTAHCHERVAGMNTVWDALGVAAFSVSTFHDRPLVLSPLYAWTVWFPHVATLLDETHSRRLPYLRSAAMDHLEDFLPLVERFSLPTVRTNSKGPIAPFRTFQQLSNMVMAASMAEMTSDAGGEGMADAMAMQGDMMAADVMTQKRRVLGMMKDLLQRYHPENQVSIVRKLIHDCPHPALQAKFMDLLRGILFEDSATDALWSYLGIYIRQLGQSIDEDEQVLTNVSMIVEKVELYIGAVTMLQLWCMVRLEMPKKLKIDTMQTFHKALQNTLNGYMSNSFGSPDDEYYRLYLLDGALQYLMDVVNTTKATGGNNTEGNSGSMGSTSSTVSNGTKRSNSDVDRGGELADPDKAIDEVEKKDIMFGTPASVNASASAMDVDRFLQPAVNQQPVVVGDTSLFDFADD